MQEILIVGSGIVTSLGAGKEQTMRSLREGVPSIGRPLHLVTDHDDLPVGEVPFSNSQMREMLGPYVPEAITRTALMGRIALREAIAEARLEERRPRRVAFISGTTVGGMDMTERHYMDFLEGEHSEYIVLHDCGSCTEQIAQQYGRGFDMMTTISTACSSAANAAILGANLIRAGLADAVVAGGSECLTRYHLNGFNSLMILDKQPCRPFDRDRAGLNLGEGAGYIVLESAESAAERGVAPLCRLAGYGNACDAYHQTATSPEGEGPYLAMREALRSAGMSPEDIDYINAHGTGTPNNDLCEGKAMMRIFGDKMPPVSSTKSFTGHSTSAAGGVESVISILALLENFVPANPGCRTGIEEHCFKPCEQAIENLKLRNVLNNSFGFGGNDSSLIFSRI